MKKIEFRGMDISGNWYYGLVSHSQGKGSQPKKGYYICNSVGMPWAYSIRSETIGQFTGSILNGKRIYEGDLIWVKEHYYGDSLLKADIYEVVFKDCEFYCESKNDKYESIFDVTKSYGGEIVGNIHEKKLLNRGKYLSSEDRKNMRIKLTRKGIYIKNFYDKHIAILNISTATFRNMYYGNASMREDVANAIAKFMGEPDETAID